MKDLGRGGVDDAHVGVGDEHDDGVVSDVKAFARDHAADTLNVQVVVSRIYQHWWRLAGLF